MKDSGLCISCSLQSTWAVDMINLTFEKLGPLLCRDQTPSAMCFLGSSVT